MRYVNRCSRTETPCELLTLWDVHEGRRYDVKGYHGSPGRIAIRTLSGKGMLQLADGSEQILEGGTLLTVESERIVRYHCVDDFWEFWWFAHLPSEELPLYELWRLAPEPLEWELFSVVFANLCQESEAARQYAVAAFNMLRSHWRLRHETASLPRNHARLAELLEKTRVAPERRWSVAELAKMAGMGERNFRDVFQQFKGCPPKRYLERLRLDAARSLLDTGLHNIKEVAERFGYSSEFHFSRNFAKQFGVPPSRRRLT